MNRQNRRMHSKNVRNLLEFFQRSHMNTKVPNATVLAEFGSPEKIHETIRHMRKYESAYRVMLCYLEKYDGNKSWQKATRDMDNFSVEELREAFDLMDVKSVLDA